MFPQEFIVRSPSDKAGKALTALALALLVLTLLVKTITTKKPIDLQEG